MTLSAEFFALCVSWRKDSTTVMRMEGARFERNRRLGLFERTPDGVIVAYPLGEMFPGVRMRDDQFFGGMWRKLAIAFVLILAWGLFLPTVFQRPRSEFAELAYQILRQHGIWFLALAQLEPLLFTPRNRRVTPTPWARQRNGELVLPMHGAGIFWGGLLFGVGGSLVAWLTPGHSSDPKYIALVTMFVEAATVGFGAAAYVAWCNWRISRASAARLAADPQAYAWPARTDL